MTVTTLINRSDYPSADGVQTAFAYLFRILQSSDMAVYDNGALVSPSAYSVTNVGVSTGGNVVFNTAPVATHAISLQRNAAYDQQTNYIDNDKFGAISVDNAFDKLTMLCQQLLEKVGRSLVFGASSTFSGIVLPDPSALKFLAWNAAGTALVNTAGVAGPAGATGPQGPAGAGSAPTVEDVSATHIIATPTFIKFDDAVDVGFLVTNPGGAGVAQISLAIRTVLGGGTGSTTAGGARTNLAAAGLADNNLFTKRQEWNQGADVAAAATTTLGTDGNYFKITGNTTITALAGGAKGTRLLLTFTGTPQLTHNGTNLILQNAQNFVAAIGDSLEFVSEGSGNFREVGRHLATITGGGPSVLDTVTAPVTISNSVAETTVYTKSIPGNTIGASGALRLLLLGTVQDTRVLQAASEIDTATIRLKYGATTLATQVVKIRDEEFSANVGCPPVAQDVQIEAGAQSACVIDVNMANLALTNSQYANVEYRGPVVIITPNSNTIPVTQGLMSNDSLSAFGTGAEDSTAAKTLVVTVQLSRAATTIVFVMKHAKLMLIP
jgi:hypothetical protein